MSACSDSERQLSFCPAPRSASGAVVPARARRGPAMGPVLRVSFGAACGGVRARGAPSRRHAAEDAEKRESESCGSRGPRSTSTNGTRMAESKKSDFAYCYYTFALFHSTFLPAALAALDSYASISSSCSGSLHASFAQRLRCSSWRRLDGKMSFSPSCTRPSPRPVALGPQTHTSPMPRP